MKTKLILILLTINCRIGFTQNFDFDLISYKGLKFHSTKTDIIETLGKPDEIYKPNYQCGFLSSDSQGLEYFTLDYRKIKFTGNEKEGYLIEQVDFQNDNTIIIQYGNHNLSCETKLTELIEIFGKEFKEKFDADPNDGIVLFHEKADDGIRIEIKDGKLIQIKYWSPC
jgi:hypothetical protein